jgi:prepilin-type N-terminal cleavage/methylation domain-containing protein
LFEKRKAIVEDYLIKGERMKRRRNSLYAKNGFTLMEVIVVLIIIAILAAIGIPAMTGYIDRAKDTKKMAEAREMYLKASVMMLKWVADGKELPKAYPNSINKTKVVAISTVKGGSGGKAEAVKNLEKALYEVCGITSNTVSCRMYIDSSGAIVSFQYRNNANLSSDYEWEYNAGGEWQKLKPRK